MTPRRDRISARCALAALCVLVLGACGAIAEGGDTTAAPLPTVLDVGGLPAPLPSTTSSTAVEPTTTTVDPTTTTVFTAPGNRILMIGDSILASTSKRYSNDMCKALVPLGWQVAIEAEVSRPIEFGVDVVRARGDEGWGAALVFLGTNYGNDDNEYLKQLNRIITELGDIPIVLVTITEFRPEIRAVNQVITALSDVYDNISIVDWREITASVPTLLNSDGIHPTPEGRQVLAEAVALHLGTAPESPGACLDSKFTDDSAGTVDGRPAGSGSGSSGSGSGGRATTTTASPTATTVRPGSTTTTTVRPGGSTTTTPATGGSATTTTATGSGGGASSTSPPVNTTPTTVPTTASPTTLGTTPPTGT